METIMMEVREEYGKMVTSCFPSINSSVSPQASEQIISNTSLNWQKLILKMTIGPSIIDKVKSYYLETIKSIEIAKPFEAISIDEFQKKYLGNIDEKALWEQFKVDLQKEVTENKISKIKYYRIISKLTQKQLAEKLGTRQPNIARIEKIGYEKIGIDTLKKLGEIFRVNYKELL